MFTRVVTFACRYCAASGTGVLFVALTTVRRTGGCNMAVRYGPAFGVAAVACGLAACAATLAAQAQAPASSASSAPRAWAPERMPDGHPDLQGVWANNTVTPLQRPKQWEGKQRLSDAEIAELQKVAAKITENDGDAQFGDGFILAVLNGIEKPNSYDPGTGNYNQFWVVDR